MSSGGVTRIGDFELLAKLGEGGMGTVYQARQLSLDRIVAVKLLPPRVAEDPEYLQRFFREARATAKLSHPNIVRGIAAGTIDGYHLFAMEYVEGGNLKLRLQKDGRLSEEETLLIAAPIASALAHAHAAGIIHRDVKPENILLDRDRTPKLADLGLVTMHGDGSLTQTGCAVGTPFYMAPEQVKGAKDIDGRADIYSLGCTLYHIATGKTPFDAPTPALLMVKHIQEKIPHPQSVNSELSDDFCAILELMLTRAREDRYASMAACANDLQELLETGAFHGARVPPLKSNFSPAGGLSASTMRSRRKATGISEAASASSRVASPSPQTDTGRRTFDQALAAIAADPRLRWALLAGVTLTAMLLTILLLALLRPGQRAPKTVERNEVVTPVDPVVPVPVRTVEPQRTDSSSPSSPAVPLFNGRNLDGWSVVRPRWRVAEGCLVGQAGETNAMLSCDAALPSDFELNFMALVRTGLHLTLSLPDANVCDVIDIDTGVLVFKKYSSVVESANRQVASAQIGDSTRAREWRINLVGSKLSVYLDGRQVLSSDQAVRAAAGKKRELIVFAHGRSELRLHDIHYHDLTQP